MSRESGGRDMEVLAKGAGFSLLGSFGGRCVVFLCQLAIARFFGPHILGIFILGQASVRIAEMVSRLGLDLGNMRFVPVYIENSPGKAKGFIISSLVISFVLGAVIGLVLLQMSDFIAINIFSKSELSEVLRFFAMSIPFVAATYVASGASQGFKTTKYSVIARDIVQPSVNLVLIFVVYSLNLHLIGLVGAYIISFVISMLLLFFFLRKQMKTIGLAAAEYEVGKMVRSSTTLMLMPVLSFAVLWADVVMVGYFLPADKVGVYRVASQLPLLMSVVLGAMNSIYAPMVSGLISGGEFARVGRILKATTRWSLYLSLPMVLFFYSASGEIMSLFGKEFVSEGSYVIIVLSIGYFINTITGGTSFTLVMAGHQKLIAANMAFILLLNLYLNSIFIPQFGLLGAAYATTLSLIVLSVVILLELFLLMKQQSFDGTFLKTAIFGVFVFFLLYMAEFYISFNDIVSFTLKISIIAISFVLYFYGAKHEDDDIELLESFKSKLFGKKRIVKEADNG